VAAEPPLKTLPSQQDIWITGTIQRRNGQYVPGDYTSLRLDRPSTSPCNDKVVTDIVLGKAGVQDPLPPAALSGAAGRSQGARHLSGFRHPLYAYAELRVSDLLTTGAARPDR